jgi:hypothetical protein
LGGGARGGEALGLGGGARGGERGGARGGERGGGRLGGGLGFGLGAAAPGLAAALSAAACPIAVPSALRPLSSRLASTAGEGRMMVASRDLCGLGRTGAAGALMAGTATNKRTGRIQSQALGTRGLSVNQAESQRPGAARAPYAIALPCWPSLAKCVVTPALCRTRTARAASSSPTLIK